jgi:hypothetical protein
MPLRRRNFQFSLRAIIFLFALLGVAFGWIARNIALVRQRERLENGDKSEFIQLAWMMPHYDWPPYLSIALGPKPVDRIYLIPDQFTAEEVHRIQLGFPESEVFFHGEYMNFPAARMDESEWPVLPRPSGKQ